MSRQGVITVENNFTRGLITEYTALNFPENAVTECDNVEFSELGRVTRRLGIDAEEGFSRVAISGDMTPADGARAEFVWTSVGTDGGRVFLAQQMGSRIRFFEQKSGDPLSSNLLPFYIDLASFSVGSPENVVAQYSVQFSQGKGYLFIAHPKCTPIYVEYIQGDPGSITALGIDIVVRDFERLDDGFSTDFRPTTYSALHHYNLLNQGWYATALTSIGTSPINVLSAWTITRSGYDYPSNADIWWLYKNSQEIAYFGDGNTNNISDGVVWIGPSNITLGNTPAPNGHYLYTAWAINRSLTSGIPGLPQLTSGVERPSCVAFFAGRVFYAGVAADKYGDKIYFSQIIESNDQFGKCYQVNDPTSEAVYDLIDSDGGVLSIAQAAKIVALVPLGDALIVLATNGVWSIRGSDNGPFRATDYTVEFISEVGTVNQSSIVQVDGQLIWVNYDAMYALVKDQIGISFQVQNISKPSIQSVLDSIPSKHKPYIKSAYNKRKRLVQFIFQSQESGSLYSYDKVLQLNVVTNSFTILTIPSAISPRIVGLVSMEGSQSSSRLDEVITLSNDSVVTSSSDEVVTEVRDLIPSTETFKYTLLWPEEGVDYVTYGEFRDSQLRDFRSYDGVGVPYNSHFVSGYRIRGESLRAFNSTPISVTVENYPTASQPRCRISGVWDYGSRESTPQELYITLSGPDYLVRRVKVRGKGKSLQLKFTSVSDAPFSVIGWATFDSGGQNP